MAELSQEVLSLIQDNVKWLNDAARHFETLAYRFDEAEKSKWGLLTTVYRERARIHQELAMRLRNDARYVKVDISAEHADGYEDRWWSLYKNAVLETDSLKLTERINVVEDAIAQRLSLDGQVSAGERSALQEARLALKSLELERCTESARYE